MLRPDADADFCLVFIVYLVLVFLFIVLMRAYVRWKI